MKIVGIIPARFGSTRFPGKPLADIAGKTMIQRVLEQTRKATLLSDVCVATDDERIAAHVQQLGEKALLTSPHHTTGTERCLEALQLWKAGADAVINIQGDEPFVEPGQIDALAKALSKKGTHIATLIIPVDDGATLFDPNRVKVVVDQKGRALYFSRQPLPHLRHESQANWHQAHRYYKHLGLYGYTCAALEAICALPPSPLEKAESLEQLRWLENGWSIQTVVTDFESPSIDTPEDLQRALGRLS